MGKFRAPGSRVTALVLIRAGWTMTKTRSYEVFESVTPEGAFSIVGHSKTVECLIDVWM